MQVYPSRKPRLERLLQQFRFQELQRKKRNWKEEKESQENGRTRKEIDDEILSSNEEFRMSINIFDSSDSDKIKHPEDNTSNAWQTVTTKQTKKKGTNTKSK